MYGKWDIEGGWVSRLRKHIDVKYNIGHNGNIQVYHLGFPGEVAGRMLERFEVELKMRIFPEEKNLVIIAIGVNDSCVNNWLTGMQTPEHKFKESLGEMIQIAIKYNCHVVCIGLTPVNPSRSKKLKFTNEDVEKYDQYLSDICKEFGIQRLDWFQDLKEGHFDELLVDAVHPNSDGHMILFQRMLQFLEANNLLPSK